MERHPTTAILISCPTCGLVRMADDYASAHARGNAHIAFQGIRKSTTAKSTRQTGSRVHWPKRRHQWRAWRFRQASKISPLKLASHRISRYEGEIISVENLKG